MAEEFVTIDLSKKQVDTSHLLHNEKTNKDYARVFAPGGGTYLYPVESIKVRSEDPERVYFSRPVGTEIQVQYGHRIEGVPDDAPNKEKYVNETHIWKIEDLKAAYDEERRQFAEQHQFENMTVPTEWGKKIPDKPYISISVPIDKKYYSFIIPEDKFKTSDREAGMSYFGFPKKKKDSEEDYTVTLRTSVKNADGTYSNSEMELSSAKLKEHVDAAVEYAKTFVTCEISERLVRDFQSKEGKELTNVAVPVQEGDKELFYEIVVPAERVKKTDDGRRRLSLFKTGPDGNEYTFHAKRSVSDGNGGYEEIRKDITSEQVISAFKKSQERFQGRSNRTLADEIKANADTNFGWEKTEDVPQTFVRRSHGR